MAVPAPPSLKASDARKMVRASIDLQLVPEARAKIDARIREAAKKGQTELHQIFMGISCDSLMEQALIKSLKADGFKYKYTPNPYPQDQRETDDHAIYWEK